MKWGSREHASLKELNHSYAQNQCAQVYVPPPLTPINGRWRRALKATTDYLNSRTTPLQGPPDNSNGRSSVCGPTVLEAWKMELNTFPVKYKGALSRTATPEDLPQHQKQAGM